MFPSFPELLNTRFIIYDPLYFCKESSYFEEPSKCSFVQISLLEGILLYTFHYTFHSNVVILITGI